MAQKREKAYMRDFELEKLAADNIKTALEYIGKEARAKNIFLGNKSKKQKNSQHLF